MTFNHSKCIFSVKKEKILGFLGSSKGINPNPKKSNHSRHDSFLINKIGSTPYKEIGFPQSVHNSLEEAYSTILQDFEEHFQL